jgi:ribosomal protein L34E
VPSRLRKRVVKKPDGRYLIYYEKKKKKRKTNKA